MVSFGCWCVMPWAALVPEKICWLVEQGGDNTTFGWPDELNDVQNNKSSRD